MLRLATWAAALRLQGLIVNHKKIRRLMREPVCSRKSLGAMSQQPTAITTSRSIQSARPVTAKTAYFLSRPTMSPNSTQVLPSNLANCRSVIAA